jgi:signal transduction histidine kinase
MRKDGTRFRARVVITALYEDDGSLRGFAKVTQDLTQQRHAAAIESASRDMTDFIAVLAHELRNPLAPIRNAVQVMKQATPGEEEFARMLQALDRQSAQLSRIVDDLLDIGRITRNTFTVQRRRHDLLEIVGRAAEAAEPGIRAARHRLELDLPDRALFVQADEVRLTQAITNLLNNATRYTDDGGRIWVTLTTENVEGRESALLRIRDTGRGIEPQFQASIFDMFVQGRKALERAGAGLGVGLALAKTIVELHHGTIEVHSEGSGKGSEFTVRLPLATDMRIVEHHPPAAAASREPAVARRVLVVDDNADAGNMLSYLLKALGHSVVTVTSGAEALNVAEEYRPEVILLDIGMPGMNGYEVARRIREGGHEPQPYLVAVTGWGKSDDPRHARAAGFDSHIVKPVDVMRLREIFSR